MPNHRSHTARSIAGTHGAECHIVVTGSGEPVARALQVIIGWYEDPLGGAMPKRRTPSRGMRSGQIVQRYLALRSEWENREAFRLAEQMSGHRHQSAGKVGARGCYEN